MKQRNGFVSNSSSSSFLIYGASIGSKTEDDFEKYEEVKALGLSFVHGPEREYNFIGISWDRIKDDETGLQFKTRIEEAAKKILGPDTKCGTHENSWYNG